MKNILFLAILFVSAGCAPKNSEVNLYPITPVEVRQVELTDNFWLPKIQALQKTTIAYAFNKCSEEGRMDNFLIAGGKMEGKTRGKMPFDDTDLYKIIEGASLSLISQPNAKLDAYLDSIINIIQIGQEPDGYLTTWFTIDRMNPPASWVTPTKERWGGEIASHELYNSGHLFEAAATHFKATGKRNMLDIALKNADLLVANFGPGKLGNPPGHQIVETGLIKLYQITHKKEYLELAKFFLDKRGDTASHKLYGAYNQDHLPVTRQTEAVGHAVRAVYMYAAMTDIVAAYNDAAYQSAINAIWENIVTKKMYLTGGIGARHEGESFGNNFELPNLTAYNETCAAIGSVYWNHRMFLLTGNKKYFDVVERTLYNGVIAGISADANKFFYPNPLESDGKYPFNMGACQRQGWFDCSCCPTNMIRFLPSVPGLIYAVRNDSVYVNLYMANKANLKINNKEVEVMQETAYPLDGKVKITVNPQNSLSLTLKLRIPGWAQNQTVPGYLYTYRNPSDQEVGLKINGKDQPLDVSGGYVVVTRQWQKGDQVELAFPMELRQVVCDTHVVENRNKIAFEYGPLVYCAEQADNDPKLIEAGLSDPMVFDNNKTEISGNMVNQFIIKNTGDNTNLTLIPYYLWDNRGIGTMKVWLDLTASKNAKPIN
jgi:uncharacterized protein